MKPDRNCKGCCSRGGVGRSGWVEKESGICGKSSVGLDLVALMALSLLPEWLIGKRNGGMKGEAIKFLLLNSYKNTINVAANPIKLLLCSCCFNLIENWSKRAFPLVLLHKKTEITHSGLVFLTLIVRFITLRRAYLVSTMFLLCGKSDQSQLHSHLKGWQGPVEATWHPPIK